jgi:hypothetical protein
VERPAPSRYRRPMPNRKTFDPRERYDHSGRPVEHAERNDLKPDVSERPDTVQKGARPPAPRRTGKPRAGH